MTDFESAILQVSQRRTAREALAEGGRHPFILQNYLAVVRQLLKLLQRHGLGQALACLQVRGDGRPNSAYTLLARQLDRWLLTNLGVSDRTMLAAISARDSRFYREASELAWLFARALAGVRQGGETMSWTWRMPRDLPWATPYPLPRDTSAALLAEGRCDNFGLLLERYLAFGDDRGQLKTPTGADRPQGPGAGFRRPAGADRGLRCPLARHRGGAGGHHVLGPAPLAA